MMDKEWDDFKNRDRENRKDVRLDKTGIGGVA